MSHQATNWAFQQKGLKPAAKIVLLYLADCHNPHYGCFPSQERLAKDCEMSRRSVNNHLDALEEANLICRIQRINTETGQRQSTRYVFAFEDEAMCKNYTRPCAKNDETHVQNLHTNLVREPVRKPTVSNNRATPRKELEKVLSPEMADAVLEHRIAIRKKLSSFAAKQLAAQFAKCADPDAAATTMIERGWQGFKPGWMEDRPRGSPSNGAAPRNPGEAALQELRRRMENEPADTIPQGRFNIDG